ncbi:MAG: histidine kinase N-terminal 7TM domain-containing protein [Burkholderiales bacterium]
MSLGADWQSAYLLATLAALFALAALAGVGLSAGRGARGRAFATVAAVSGGWTASTIAMALASPSAAPLWLNVKYVFIAFTPVAVAWFVLEFTAVPRRRVQVIVAVLCAWPAVRVALVWTDWGRDWLIRDVSFARSGVLTHVDRIVYGPLHPLAVTFGYGVLIGSVLAALVWAARAGPLARRQGLAIAGAGAAPAIATGLFLLGITPAWMDPMPLGVTITCALIGWAVLRHRLLDLSPVARDVVLDTMEDGILATDPDGRVVDLNRAMAGLLGVLPSEIVGRPVAPLLRALGEAGVVLSGDSTAPFATIGGRHFAVRVVPLRVRPEAPAGRLLMLHDLTDRVRAEDEREHLITELRLALAQVRTLSGLLPVCAGCKSIRDTVGSWRPADEYLREHSDATVSHAMCPDCSHRLYPAAYREVPHV